MTVIFTEGFDNMGASDGATYGKWLQNVVTGTGAGAGSQSHAVTTGRFGTGQAFSIAGSVQIAWTPIVFFTFDVGSEQATSFVGLGVNFSSFVLGNVFAQFQDENSAAQLLIVLGTGNFIQVYRGTTSNLLCTSSISIALNAWYFVEVGAFISPTAGWVELKINGQLAATYYGASGTNRGNSNGNTRASSISGARIYQFGCAYSGTFSVQYDDICINNSAGSNNDFLGEVRVIGELPTGVGTYSQFTRNGGTSSGNYTAVNENPINGDSSYVSSPTIGTIDTYTYPSLPSNVASIIAVVGEPTARRDDAGARSIVTHVINNSAEADSSQTDVLQTTYRTPENIMEVNPVTGVAWVASDINSGEFGQKITA